MLNDQFNAIIFQYFKKYGTPEHVTRLKVAPNMADPISLNEKMLQPQAIEAKIQASSELSSVAQLRLVTAATRRISFQSAIFRSPRNWLSYRLNNKLKYLIGCTQKGVKTWSEVFPEYLQAQQATTQPLKLALNSLSSSRSERSKANHENPAARDYSLIMLINKQTNTKTKQKQNKTKQI